MSVKLTKVYLVCENIDRRFFKDMIIQQYNFNHGNYMKELSLCLDQSPIRLVNPYQVQFPEDVRNYIFGELKKSSPNIQNIRKIILDYSSEIKAAGTCKSWITLRTLPIIPMKKIVTPRIILNSISYDHLRFYDNNQVKNTRKIIIEHPIYTEWITKQTTIKDLLGLEKELFKKIKNDLREEAIIENNPIDTSWGWKDITYQKISLLCTVFILGELK